MFDLATARDIALRTGHELEVFASRELREGWFFPCAGNRIGSSGVIVNKATGRVLVLGSAFPLERDLRAYDEGFQFDRCDLVITGVRDSNASTEGLAKIRPTVVEPHEEHGTVWRVPRELRRDEIRQRLSKLPCVFEQIRLYFVVEHLQQARAERWFDFSLASGPSRQR